MTSLLPTYPTAEQALQGSRDEAKAPTISSPEVDKAEGQPPNARASLSCSECGCALGDGESGRCSVCFARSQEEEW